MQSDLLRLFSDPISSKACKIFTFCLLGRNCFFLERCKPKWEFSEIETSSVSGIFLGFEWFALGWLVFVGKILPGFYCRAGKLHMPRGRIVSVWSTGPHTYRTHMCRDMVIVHAVELKFWRLDFGIFWTRTFNIRDNIIRRLWRWFWDFK